MRWLAVIAFVLAILSTSACSSIDSTFAARPAGGGDSTQVVKVGTLRGQPHLFHPFFYERFAPAGTAVDVVVFDSSPDIKNALVSGAIDFGVAGVPAFLAGSAAGQDIRLIASAADGGTGIVAAPGIDSVDELRGQKVGFPLGSSQEILLRLTLARQGLDPARDVQLVNLPFSDMANALATGQISAFASAELGPATAIEAGAHSLISPYDTPVGRVNIGLATTQRTIDTQPGLVQSMVDVHLQTAAFMDGDRDAWHRGVVDEFGLDPDVAATAIANIWPRADLSADYRSQVGALTRQMVALGQIPVEPDLAAFVDDSFLTASAHA
ncbi:ABC transporter substrate-binding protein [Prescottella defluvii]|nr:ABC transporter substrate-binding protein [Prescottella defluvii]